MKKIIFILFIFVLISCNNNIQENKSTEKIKIRVGYLSEFAGASTVAVAKEKGFFEEENLDAELFQFFNGHAAIISMISKEIDFSYIGHATHFLIINGKAQILFPDSISKAEQIISAKYINSISDLKGKTVATHFGTSGEAMLYAALKSSGLEIDDIKLSNINVTNLSYCLTNKKVDAISTWVPYTMDITNNYKVLAYITNYSNIISLTSSFVSTEEYIEQNPEIVKKFSRAMLKAMDYKKNHLDETAYLVSKLNRIEVESIKKEIDASICFDSSDIKKACENGDILKWYETQQNVFLKSHVIKKSVPVTNYIQLEMLRNVLESL